MADSRKQHEQRSDDASKKRKRSGSETGDQPPKAPKLDSMTGRRKALEHSCRTGDAERFQQALAAARANRDELYPATYILIAASHGRLPVLQLLLNTFGHSSHIWKTMAVTKAINSGSPDCVVFLINQCNIEANREFKRYLFRGSMTPDAIRYVVTSTNTPLDVADLEYVLRTHQDDYLQFIDDIFRLPFSNAVIEAANKAVTNAVIPRKTVVEVMKRGHWPYSDNVIISLVKAIPEVTPSDIDALLSSTKPGNRTLGFNSNGILVAIVKQAKHRGVDAVSSLLERFVRAREETPLGTEIPRVHELLNWINERVTVDFINDLCRFFPHTVPELLDYAARAGNVEVFLWYLSQTVFEPNVPMSNVLCPVNVRRSFWERFSRDAMRALAHKVWTIEGVQWPQFMQRVWGQYATRVPNDQHLVDNLGFLWAIGTPFDRVDNFEDPDEQLQPQPQEVRDFLELHGDAWRAGLPCAIEEQSPNFSEMKMAKR